MPNPAPEPTGPQPTAAARPDIDLLEHLAVLEIQPGDVLVLTCPELMSTEQGLMIRDQLREAVPSWKDIDVVVLSGGLEMGAVRMTDA